MQLFTGTYYASFYYRCLNRVGQKVCLFIIAIALLLLSKSLQGIVVTETALGGLIVHPPVANFL